MDIYVVVDHNRHTDDKFTVVNGYDKAKQVAKDLAIKNGYVDKDGNPESCSYGYYGWGEDYYIDIIEPANVIGFN